MVLSYSNSSLEDKFHSICSPYQLEVDEEISQPIIIDFNHQYWYELIRVIVTGLFYDECWWSFIQQRKLESTFSHNMDKKGINFWHSFEFICTFIIEKVYNWHQRLYILLVPIPMILKFLSINLNIYWAHLSHHFLYIHTLEYFQSHYICAIKIYVISI